MTVVRGSLDIPLPTEKLSYCSSGACSADCSERKQLNVILLATGSFNPPTYMHLRMFELAKDALISEGFTVLGGYMSPVNDAYGKKVVTDNGSTYKAAGRLLMHHYPHLYWTPCTTHCIDLLLEDLGKFPWIKKDLASSDHRINMCELATADSSFIMVDPWEAKQNTYQRTLAVLKRMENSLDVIGGSSASGPIRIMLLCGADLLESFSVPGVWIPEQVKGICRDYGIVCISRGQKSVSKIVFENDILFEFKKKIIIVEEPIENNISSTKVRQCLARGLSVRYLVPDSVIDYINQNKLYQRK